MNSEHKTAQNNAWRESHPHYDAEYYLLHREERRDKNNQRVREYYLSHPEKQLSRTLKTKKWREENPERKVILNKEDHLKRTYGLTLEDYDALFNLQGGKCCICKKHQSELTRCLVVDHDHNTGNIRGLLCANCNSAIGFLQDNIDLARTAVEYLEKWK